MNSQDLYNLQEAYLDVYYVDEEREPGVKEYKKTKLQPLPEPKPLSGERGDGSGWKNPKTKTENPLFTVNPGNPEEVAKVLHRTRPRQHGPTGSSIRIMGPMGKDATRVSSEVENITNGATRNISRSRRLPPQEKKKPSREIVRKTKKEDFELWVNDLLDEGYDLSGYTWDELYENYQQLNEISPALKRRAAEASAKKVSNAQRAYDQASRLHGSAGSVPYGKMMRQRAEQQHRRLVKAAYPNEGYDLSGYTWDELYENYQQLNEISPALKRRAAEASAKKVSNAQRAYDQASRLHGSAGSVPYGKMMRQRAEQQHRRLVKAAYPNANEQVDIYDVILSHLINEGYADTFEAAEAIMVSMSEEWRESIVEEENETPIEKKSKYGLKAPAGYMKTRKPTLQQMSSREKEAWRNRGIGA